MPIHRPDFISDFSGRTMRTCAGESGRITARLLQTKRAYKPLSALLQMKSISRKNPDPSGKADNEDRVLFLEGQHGHKREDSQGNIRGNIRKGGERKSVREKHCFSHGEDRRPDQTHDGGLEPRQAA